MTLGTEINSINVRAAAAASTAANAALSSSLSTTPPLTGAGPTTAPACILRRRCEGYAPDPPRSSVAPATVKPVTVPPPARWKA
ncbi:hypothetical protein GCM10022285_60290 [Streptomyces tunisiensis]|uniref:Uncharacterized protein n=1 Tax=Streptomyces tunisiensis TaxID=948699 RepID=A0ABP7Z8Z8_9ACTN